MSGTIHTESHSGSHRGSSCAYCRFGKNASVSDPCRHKRHAPFAKIGVPCKFYKYQEQEAVERKHGKNKKTRVCCICKRELPESEFKKSGNWHGRACSQCQKDYNNAYSEKRRAKEHALLEAGREKLSGDE